MASIEEQIRDVRTAISQATQRTTRAQVERDAAKAKADEAERTLADEFQVKDESDARKLLASLKKQLQDEIDKAEAQLAEADA